MTKIVVRLQAPGIKRGSFSALPKTMYIAGPRYTRIEDPPDARQGIQKLTIINGSDAYSVNVIDKKGTHASSAGGDNVLRTPIVLPFDPNHEMGALDDLEFGDELAFFKDAGAVHEAGPIINAKPTDAYVLKLDAATATLVVRSGSSTPVTLSWQSKSGDKWTYEYIVDQQMPFDPKLFAKPTGYSLKEMPPDTGTEGL
jgi:hypothetical protein